jgi:hypothetical protein
MLSKKALDTFLFILSNIVKDGISHYLHHTAKQGFRVPRLFSTQTFPFYCFRIKIAKNQKNIPLPLEKKGIN